MLRGRPPSHTRRTTSSSGPLVWLVEPAQRTLNSQPIGAAKWGICLQGQPQDICLPKGGGPAPRGAQSSAGLGLVRRENRVSRGWVSKSEHSTSGQWHLSRHTLGVARRKGRTHAGPLVC